MPKQKKVKKTKAQIEEERLAAEEAERKAKEIEDKRLAEEAERDRLEALRIAAERTAFRKDEMIRLMEEHNKMEDFRKDMEYQLVAEEKQESARLEWLRYKDPTDEPDPSSESDLNTFLSLIAENEVQKLSSVLKLVRRVEHVAKSVEKVWADSIANQNHKMREITESYMVRFSNLILEKVDIATAHLLRFMDDYVNDRKEIQIEDGTERLFIGIWTTLQDPRPSRKSIEFEKLFARLDIPKQILQHDGHFIHRIVRMPIETLSYCAFHPDASRSDFYCHTDKYVVGDLIMIDILRPPPGALFLRAKRWTVHDKSTQSLNVQKNIYPSTVPCKCSIRVPEEVFMTDTTTMAIWDEEQRRWTEEGISDFQYIESTRQVQFYTTAVGLFALVKSRTAEMPYKSWKLQPVRTSPVITDASTNAKLPEQYERHARLTVQTQTQEIIIDIIGTHCKLLEPNVSQLADLVGVETTPGALLHTLQRRGINLLPTAMDSNRCNALKKPVKTFELEIAVLEEIARCAGAMDFQSTPWNQMLSKDQVAVQMRETAAFTGEGEDFDCEMILAEMDNKSVSYMNATNEGVLPGAGVKFLCVMGNEYGNKPEFSDQPRPNEVTHLSLSESIARRVMPEAIERIKRINVRFRKTVLTVLRLLRPLSLN
mmetsp:Transcript_38898/g.39584  ORF Transcript_38898/g.39584 Transcript_38898/m.39584 type:complete len:654 (+) Transcript_38898:146-2107(+)|eukprot:CAMPEP_0182418342 /NCGR_PEP_ID=MMETSP1167-20130531/2799_1 /TAXON_ID=2988 /ORGANISM="Mallomonas Sp, Strain CCMP3275" /LENGTH=653 /DNA_ID=CAMNT_0024592505 /DNA_START=134 /DNA_END=2095 /DNA_ORIENTATION=+